MPPICSVIKPCLLTVVYSADITIRNCRRTHNKCLGRHQNRPAWAGQAVKESEESPAAAAAAAVVRWGWETRCSYRRRRRRRRPRRHCPPTRRQSAPTCPACPPARPSCACFTKNIWPPSGTESNRAWLNAGHNSCTAGGTVPWAPRT